MNLIRHALNTFKKLTKTATDFFEAKRSTTKKTPVPLSAQMLLPGLQNLRCNIA